MEAKEILDFLGFSDVDSLDKFKEKFPSSFIKLDQEVIRGHEIYGKLIGGISNGTVTALKRALKKHEVKVDDKALDGKLENVIENIFDSVAAGYSSQIKSLKEDSGKTTDEKVKELEKQIADSKAAIESITGEKNKIAGDYETYKTTVQTQIKTDKLNSAQEKLWGSMKWANGIKELEKAGFKATIGQKYKFDLDEEGGLVPLDLKGNKIKNPNKADAFLTPEEILVLEGTKENVYALNPHGGGNHTPPGREKRTEPATGGQPADVRRQINKVGRDA